MDLGYKSLSLSGEFPKGTHSYIVVFKVSGEEHDGYCSDPEIHEIDDLYHCLLENVEELQDINDLCFVDESCCFDLSYVPVHINEIHTEDQKSIWKSKLNFGYEDRTASAYNCNWIKNNTKAEVLRLTNKNEELHRYIHTLQKNENRLENEMEKLMQIIYVLQGNTLVSNKKMMIDSDTGQVRPKFE